MLSNICYMTLWFTPAPADLSDFESPSCNMNCRHYSPFQRKAC